MDLDNFIENVVFIWFYLLKENLKWYLITKGMHILDNELKVTEQWSLIHIIMSCQECLLDTLITCCPKEVPSIKDALLVIGLESALLLGKRNTLKCLKEWKKSNGLYQLHISTVLFDNFY